MKIFKPSPTITKAQFTKMNKVRRIIYLAKDVLAQLKAEKYKTRTHIGYLRFIAPNYEDGLFAGSVVLDGKSAKDVISDSHTTCHVCAKGALVCSYVRNFSGVTCDKLELDHNTEMIELFGKKLWTEIEEAYEGFAGYNDNPLEDIMQNLIDNKGVLNRDTLSMHSPYRNYA